MQLLETLSMSNISQVRLIKFPPEPGLNLDRLYALKWSLDYNHHRERSSAIKWVPVTWLS